MTTLYPFSGWLRPYSVAYLGESGHEPKKNVIRMRCKKVKILDRVRSRKGAYPKCGYHSRVNNFECEAICLERRNMKKISSYKVRKVVDKNTDHQMPGEACEARKTKNIWQDMESELLWSFYYNMFTCGIPMNHMVIFRTLEKTACI